MYMLVFVAVAFNQKAGYMEPRVEQWYTFENFYECFEARESLSNEIGKGGGYFYPNSQAVCIPIIDNGPEK
jgi:hypothetical protein